MKKQEKKRSIWESPIESLRKAERIQWEKERLEARLEGAKKAIEAQANEAKERAEFYSLEWKEALKKGKAEALAPNGFFQSHFNFWNARSLALFGALGLLEAMKGMEAEAFQGLLEKYEGKPEKQSKTEGEA